MSMIIPPYLKPGDKIGMVCPAGYMPFEKAQTAINTLQDWGYEVVTGSTVGSQFNYFSGTDEQRLNDLQQMMDDDSIKAILCARGGYGTGRIIDQLNFKKLKKNPKWIIGFSDITILHYHLFSKYKIASIHGPMASAFNNDGFKNAYVQSLQKVLAGDKIYHECAPHVFNKKGTAAGTLVGGNLSIINHLLHTPSDIPTKNKIFFIEDVGEYIYNIDRMLYQLKRAGRLSDIAGLIIGGFTDMKDTQIPLGESVQEVIRDIVKEYDYPVCFNFPVSHGTENYALKFGMKYTLSVGKKVSELEEI